MPLTRRQLLQGSALAAGGSLAGCALPARRVRGKHELLRIGIVGTRSQGRRLLASIHERPGVQVAALCDVDPRELKFAGMLAARRARSVTMYRDLRALFDDGSLDAVVLALPDHWHALALSLACAQGLDVFVESPVSHSLGEGMLMQEVAARHGRIVQCSLPHRVAPALQQARRFLQRGELGRLLAAEACCYVFRRGIGRQRGAGRIPAGLDYSLWCGPLSTEPLRRRRLHGDWRWQWAAGNGELGATGVQLLDLFHMLVVPPGRPRRVWSCGGRMGLDDDGETPDTLVVGFDFGRYRLCYQQRALPARLHSSQMDSHHGVGTGLVLHCQGGRLVVDLKAGLVAALGAEGRLIRRFHGGGDLLGNFFSALRSGDPGQLQAPLRLGCASAELMHLANISHRAARPASRAEMLGSVGEDPLLCEALDGMDQHLAANGYDLMRRGPKLGDWLPVQEGREPLPAWPELAELANRSYRDGFRLPGAQLSF